MSTTRFKACYSMDITEFKDDIKAKLEEWNVPIEEEDGDHIELVRPFQLLTGEGKVVLQIVMKDEESFGGEHMAFSPDIASAVFERLSDEHLGIIQYAASGGFFKLFPTAYTWCDGSDEPIIL